MDPKIIDELSQKLADALPGNPGLLRSDLEKNIRAVLDSVMGKMNLVSRQEFEIQQQVLARTREKLEKLEQLIADLEKNIQS